MMMWSGRLEENQVASVLPTTDLFYRIRFHPGAPHAALPQSPRADGLRPVETLSLTLLEETRNLEVKLKFPPHLLLLSNRNSFSWELQRD